MHNARFLVAPAAIARSCALSPACAQSQNPATHDPATQDPAKDAAAKGVHSAAALRSAVEKAIAWIEKQAVPVENAGEGQADAVTFPSSQEQPETRPAIVYG